MRGRGECVRCWLLPPPHLLSPHAGAGHLGQDGCGVGVVPVCHALLQPCHAVLRRVLGRQSVVLGARAQAVVVVFWWVELLRLDSGCLSVHPQHTG